MQYFLVHVIIFHSLASQTLYPTATRGKGLVKLTYTTVDVDSAMGWSGRFLYIYGIYIYIYIVYRVWWALTL